MDIHISKEPATGRTTLAMTPSEQDIYNFGMELRKEITRTLAEKYIEDFGDKILESISPEIIASDIKKYVSNKFWENKKGL